MVSNLFYSFIIYLLLSIIGIIPFKVTTIIKSLLPISTNQYWFITNYIPLTLIGPYISKTIINNSQKENLKILIILSFLTLTLFSISNQTFPLGKINTSGYNFIWFTYVFIVGGYLRLYEPFMNKTRLIYYIFIALLLFSAIEATINHIRTGENTFFSINYNGISFIFSVLFFLIIKNIRINTNNVINKTLIKIAPYTFGVYLIHDNFFIRNILWYRNLFHFENHFNTYYFVPYLLAICILIFSVCVAIDKTRSLLFKVLQVDKGITFTRIKLSETFNRFYYKFIEHK